MAIDPIPNKKPSIAARSIPVIVHDSFIVSAASYGALETEMRNSFDEITGYTAKLKATVTDETLKSDLDKMAQQLDYDDSGKLTKVGVNASDTWDGYKEERDNYKGYSLREELWKAAN